MQLIVRHSDPLNCESWLSTMTGGVVQLHDLQNMPAKTLVVTLECAGNGRSLMNPPVDGEQWGLGAVSTAEWTGIPLTDVLSQAGVDSRATEIVMRGGTPASTSRVIQTDLSAAWL